MRQSFGIIELGKAAVPQSGSQPHHHHAAHHAAEGNQVQGRGGGQVLQFRRACPQIACGGKKLEQVISADVVFAQEFVMVQFAQLGEQDEADGECGKTGGLRGQPKVRRRRAAAGR